MQRNIRAIDILILAEIVVLVVVLCFSGVSALTGGDEESTYEARTEAITAAEEAADIETETSTSGEENEENVAEEIPEIYEEDRITFSNTVEELLTSLTTEQLAAQLFITTPEELTGVTPVNVAGDGTRSALEEYPVAGLIYSEQNFSYSSQTRNLLSGAQEYIEEITGIDLFLIVEETGGEDGSPVASSNDYDVQDSPAQLALAGDADAVAEAAAARAEYLLSDGFNTVYGPVAEAADGTDEDFDEKTYSSDSTTAEETASYVAADIAAMAEAGLTTIVRAFPGTYTAASDYTIIEAAIEAGTSIIEAGSVTDSSVTGDDTTLALFSAGTTITLRQTLGFEGVIMTCDLAGDAITEQYTVGEAAVKAIQSGMNLLYITDGFEEAYEAVLEAIESGEITETMLLNAVGRILTVKTQ